MEFQVLNNRNQKWILKRVAVGRAWVCAFAGPKNDELWDADVVFLNVNVIPEHECIDSDFQS